MEALDALSNLGHPHGAAMAELPPTVGRYRVQRQLSGTPESPLYLSHDDTHECDVAVQVFAADAVGNRQAFERQAILLRRLTHPHIAAVLDADLSGEVAFVVFDLPPGVPLAEAIGGRVTPLLARKLDAMAKICRALAYARTHAIDSLNVHPAFLFVSLDGADIQIAGVRMPDDQSEIVPAGGLGYMAPEEITGQRGDERSDVFRIGAVLYEWLTYEAAFDGNSLIDRVQNTLQASPPPLPMFAELPGHELDRIVARALAKAPDARYPSLEDFALELQQLARRAEHASPDSSVAAGSSGDDTDSPADTGSVLMTGHRERAATGTGDTPRAADDDDAGTDIGTAPVVVSMPAPAASEPARDEPIFLDEHVQFTVFRPRALVPERWETMLVFAHLSEAPPDQPDAPDPIEEVQRQAERVLGTTGAHTQHTADSLQAVPREGELTLAPHVEGVEFNPPSRSFRWTESVHREEFRLRASRDLVGRVARGRVSVFLGSIILAEISIAMKVEARATAPSEPPVQDSARRYRRIFASYSHDDVAIVKEFSEYARAVGDRYLQDVVDLRGGERWQPRLEAMIREADVFQLFWSWNALASPHVRHEWEYAVALNRPSFVRPVYWDDPLPQRGDLPPETLRTLHFQRIQPSAVVGQSHPPLSGSVPAPPLAVPVRAVPRAMRPAAPRARSTVGTGAPDTVWSEAPSSRVPPPPPPPPARAPRRMWRLIAPSGVAVILLAALLLPGQLNQSAPPDSEKSSPLPTRPPIPKDPVIVDRSPAGGNPPVPSGPGPSTRVLRLRAADGSVLTNLEVEIWSADQPQPITRAVSNSSGVVAVRLPPGSYQLAFVNAQGVSHRLAFTVAADRGELTLRLPR